MIEAGHGLVIGKFYPPHRGHHELLRQATAGCRHVSVLVMASSVETISMVDRMAWLRAEHPDVQIVGIRCDAPLDTGDEQVWAAQVAAMRAGLRHVTDEPVTSVWSAEDYGDELARRLGAVHHRVARTHDGLSASQIRADPAALWPMLAPATRAGLTTRVVVVGAESTGTTTVSQVLAAHYRARGGPWADTRCVDEYGREFTEVVWARQTATARERDERPPALDEVSWTPQDFDEVAAEQTRREDEAAAAGSPLLVCDTDAFATSIWERRYLAAGARTGQTWASAPALPRHDLYFVTDHADVPWHDDGLREGDLAIRAAMTGWFMDALTTAGHSWVLLTGSLDQRVALAVRTVDQLLAHRLGFARPLHGPGFEAEAIGNVG